jgi:hypothetical protein
LRFCIGGRCQRRRCCHFGSLVQIALFVFLGFLGFIGFIGFIGFFILLLLNLFLIKLNLLLLLNLCLLLFRLPPHLSFSGFSLD